MLEKRNRHALQCVQIETQLVYANLEAFVYILSGYGNSQLKGSSDVCIYKISRKLFIIIFFFSSIKLLCIWKNFANKVSQLGQNYAAKSSVERTNINALRK